jgi:Domain of unknown function (DUF4037)
VTPFVAGLRLAGEFYRHAVRPILDLPHGAALLGPGSDVLGFDTVRSTDHDWGPRLLLFLHPDDRARHGQRLHDVLAQRLPASFAGYSTNFAPAGVRVQVMTPVDGPPVNHRVVVTDVPEWTGGWLCFDPLRGVSLVDWLATPTQRLAEATGGAVFHDGLGQLNPMRRALAWYPDDVWRYVLACGWQRIGEEEAFVGRCAEVDDEAGAAVVTARLVRDLMRLHLLMHRRYPPYSKWLGTATARLPHGDAITRTLHRALTTGREEDVSAAYEQAAAAHNALGLTAPIDPSPRPFHDRPFQVLDAGRFATALHATINDPDVRALPLLGGIDQFADSTALLGDIARCRAVTQAALGLPTPA